MPFRWILTLSANGAEIAFTRKYNLIVDMTLVLASVSFATSSMVFVMLLMTTAIKITPRKVPIKVVNIISTVVRRSSKSVRPLICAKHHRVEAVYQKAKPLH